MGPNPSEIDKLLKRLRGIEGNDANLIDRLKRAAKNVWEGRFVAMQAPMAPDTWEIKVPLAKADAQAEGSIRFDRPIRIIGILPIVTLTAAVGGDVAATPDDLEVRLVVDGERNFTQGNQDVATGQRADFVTLSAMGILTPRLVGRIITNPSPTVTATIKGKRGAGVYAPCDVRLAFFTEYLEGGR